MEQTTTQLTSSNRLLIEINMKLKNLNAKEIAQL